MADLDRDLSGRLARLAEAVPTGRLDPAHVRAVEARHHVRMAWMTPLVALVVVVIGATLLAGGNEPGSTTAPSGSRANGPVAATTRSGDFELTIRAGQSQYVAGEAIDIQATLTYLGEGGPIEIGHLIGSDGSPIGFGVNESIFGGYRLGSGDSRLVCHRTTLARSDPLTTSFIKTGGGSGADEAGFLAFMADPVLWLAAGTWHPYAMVQSANGCVDGRHAVPDMRVEIEIEVVPAPSEAPNGPLAVTVTDGPFALTIRSTKARYAVGEPIEIEAVLRYTGSAPSVEISHGLGSNGSPLAFGIAEPIPIEGGQIRLPAGYPLICAGPCPSPAEVCIESQLVAGSASALPFEKRVHLGTEIPDTSAAQAYILDPELHLPAGTWRPYVLAEFSEGEVQPCRDHALRAEIEIEVAPARAETQAPADAGPTAVDRDGAFSLELRASKARYAPNEAIDVLATLLFHGPGESINFRHDSSGPIMFGIREKVFGEIDVGPISILMWDRTTLQRSVPYTRTFIKGGGLMGDHPDQAMHRAWLEDPVLRLPEGTWHISAGAGAEVLEGDSITGGFSLSTEIEIVVDDDPAATPGHPPATEYPFKPVYGGADIGGMALQLKSERPVYEVGAPIDLSVWYWFMDGPEVSASHFQPEVALSIEQLDATDPNGREVLIDSICTDLGLVTGGERHVEIGPGLITLFQADAVPATLDDLFVDGALHLPIGRWRISASVIGKFGPCSGGGEPYEISTSLDIEVLPNASSEIELVTASQPYSECPMARGAGILGIHPISGLGVRPLFGDLIPVRWPFGYTARREADGAVLIDDQGRVVAREGDNVEFAGGRIEDGGALDGGFFACTGIRLQ